MSGCGNSGRQKGLDELEKIINEQFNENETEVDFEIKKVVKPRKPVHCTIQELESDFAVISDVHSNYYTLGKILPVIKDTLIICLGDIVGYGPNPNECIEAIADHVDKEHICLGNHDVALVQQVLQQL